MTVSPISIALRCLLLLVVVCIVIEARQRRRARKEVERQKLVAELNRTVTFKGEKA